MVFTCMAKSVPTPGGLDQAPFTARDVSLLELHTSAHNKIGMLVVSSLARVPDSGFLMQVSGRPHAPLFAFQRFCTNWTVVS